VTSIVQRIMVLALLTTGLLLPTGCKGPTRPSPFVIPGPTVPSDVPTALPYVWDTRDELAVWVENPVARGSLSVEGSGADGLIRIDRAEREWVLRGPDLTPPVTGVRTLRVRYRWRPDPGLSSVETLTLRATAFFQTTATLQPFYHGQGAASANLEPQDDWTDISFVPGQFTPPIDVSYCYVYSSGANRGVLEVDRIELVR
jgi:hypothetical protein